MKQIDKEQIEEFWAWFAQVSDPLIAGIERPGLMSRLDDRVRELHPALRWEITPGLIAARQFTISPNMDRELRDTAQQIISSAPVLTHWEFYAARMPKEWNYRLQIENPGMHPLELDASDWKFVFLSDRDDKYQVLLNGSNLPGLAQKQRWQAAGDVLCNVAGEEAVMEMVSDFELVYDLPPFVARRSRSILTLRLAFARLRRCEACS
ncbi:MAG TPA: hypothetical protein VFK06_17940 [Candidatus Angelobacter sp.]|nr:hypothetical protein [Candidatus Angelobacter sp.]